MDRLAGVLRVASRARLPEAPEAGRPAIELRGVVVHRGGRQVLRGIDLALHAGEVVALCGPNGAGKSSLLETMAGDLWPTNGDVRLDGRPVQTWSPIEAAMRRAVLLQRSSIAFAFTVEEVVRMGRAPWSGTEREEDDDRQVHLAMEVTEVAGLAGRGFLSLSGGERARTVMARTLAQQTAVILLDEPTAALDVRHQELVLALIRDRAAAGSAVVIAIHDLTAAAAVADRLLLVENGRIVADGPPIEVLHADALSRVYNWPLEVLAHPRTGAPLVLPQRQPR